jgi:hypothetical protein
MKSYLLLTVSDRSTISMAMAAEARRHIRLLQQSARSTHEHVISSLACIQSSLQIERKKAPPPDSSIRPVPESHSAKNGMAAPPASECEVPLSSGSISDHESAPLPLSWWDIYPVFPKSIRLGEVEAANERDAIEKAVKKFQQDPAKLIAVGRTFEALATG